jgi:hypothetical protein
MEKFILASYRIFCPGCASPAFGEERASGTEKILLDLLSKEKSKDEEGPVFRRGATLGGSENRIIRFPIFRWAIWERRESSFRLGAESISPYCGPNLLSRKILIILKYFGNTKHPGLFSLLGIPRGRKGSRLDPLAFPQTNYPGLLAPGKVTMEIGQFPIEKFRAPG